MDTTNLSGKTGSGCKQSDVAELQLIEEKHGYATNDWPRWAVRARPFQFTTVLPVFAVIVRFYGGQNQLVTPVSIIGMALTVAVARRFITWRYQRRGCDDMQPVVCGSSPCVPDQRAWIECIGMRQELDRMRSLNANFFEPRFVQYMPYPYLWNDWVALTTTVIVLFAFRTHGLVLDILTPSLAFAGLMVIPHAFSGYIRIVPGRLDILDVPLFRPGGFRLVKTISLRHKSIVCHFAMRKLTLRPREVAETPSTCNLEYGTAESVDFDLRRVATPHAFVAFVIQGAMCSIEAPAG